MVKEVGNGLDGLIYDLQSPKGVKDPNPYLGDAFIERIQEGGKAKPLSPKEVKVTDPKPSLVGRIQQDGKEDGISPSPKVASDSEVDEDLRELGYLSEREYQKRLREMTGVDDVEDKTMNILIHLQTLADGKSRKDIEAATRHTVTDIDLDGIFQKAEDIDNLHESRFNPFRQDTNFDDQDHMDRPAHTFRAVKKLISALASILFGVELLKPVFKDRRSFAEMEDGLNEDRTLWQYTLTEHYKPYFERNINEAFAKAESLINERKDYAKVIYYQRITFYATALIAIVGLFLSRKIVAYLGLAASTVTFIFMLTQYGSTSFKQANLAAELQSSREFLEKIGSTNRIFTNPFEPDPLPLK